MLDVFKVFKLVSKVAFIALGTRDVGQAKYRN